MSTNQSICPRFSQNAWKKDLCSNCFKSKEEHKASLALAAENKAKSIKKTEEKLKSHPQPKGIIKNVYNRTKHQKKNCKVNFTKELTEVIGYGGSWSDSDFSDDDDSENDGNNVVLNNADDLITDDEIDLELKRLTKSNTNFNMNNGNLLGDPEENIKKSFAALKLGSAPVDKEGKKQTLKINVLPFGSSLMSNKLSSMKSKFESKKTIPKPSIEQKTEYEAVKLPEIKAEILKEPEVDGKCSPPIERAMERSLLDEISETLEKNKEVQKYQSDKDGKIKFEVSTQQSKECKIYQDLKKPISRNAPITKDAIKPRINVFPKYQDSESSTASDSENCISAYYDVIETTNNGYENVFDGKKSSSDESETITYTSSTQFLTDILLSNKTRSASYNLHEGNFMTSKITNDGLIVTKCNSDDALDSTGSSFDGSSDEDCSYNMNKSESDSGIGITIGTVQPSETIEKKTSVSTNNSDYEDIQVSDVTTIIKCRELAGEPDGSADPDGNAIEIVPALPKCPPPQTSEVRTSFLHTSRKLLVKPELPVKPTTTMPLKTITKRQPTTAEQQVISQLQQKITQQPTADDSKDLTSDSKMLLLKKSKAPNPPPESPTKSSPPTTPEKDYNTDPMENVSNLFAKNSNKIVTTVTPVLREKDKRERATINPKFRSLNTLSNRKNQQLQQTLILTKPSTPEPIPRNKTLSMSEEFLNGDDKKKKNKFSIKKFLRMGTSKTTDNLQKKDGIYSEIIAGDEVGVCGKPRLVIIHPIDINPSTIEVVKTPTNNNAATNSIPEDSATDSQNNVVVSKPPAPPHRTMDRKLNATNATNTSQNLQNQDANKPARPPPPKSAELRRKQQSLFTTSNSTNTSDGVSGTIKCKSDTVYANLGMYSEYLSRKFGALLWK